MEKHLEESLALLADFLEFNKQCEMSLTQITGYELADYNRFHNMWYYH